MEKSLKGRLDILKEAKMLDEKTIDSIYLFLDKIKSDYNIVVNDEKFGVFVSHVSAMYLRSKNGEKVDALSSEIVDELKSSSNYEKTQDMLQDLESALDFEVEDIEKDYLVLHLINILDKARD